MQLYLRRDEVHWVSWEPGLRPARGVRKLDEAARKLLYGFQSLLTPAVAEFEAAVAARANLGIEQLPVVAAARCASAALVESEALVDDFLLFLPTAARRDVRKMIDDLKQPGLDEVCEAIAAVIPDDALTASGELLLISADQMLTRLPFALARSARWGQSLIELKFPALLAPMNVLAAAPPTAATWPAEWLMSEIGNGAGNLAFAGRRTPVQDFARAFVIPSREQASRSAVLYRGHLADPPAGRPSESGLVVAPSRVIPTRALFADSSEWWTPRRLALLACRAAGWDFSGEWGGFGAAAMLRGTEDFVAPIWPLIDAAPAQSVDRAVLQALGSPGDLWRSLWAYVQARDKECRANDPSAVPPHWWAGLAFMPR